MKNKRLKNTCINLITICLPVLLVIGVAEIILRHIGPAYYKISNTSSDYYSNPRGYHIPMKKEGRYIIYGLPYRESPEHYRLPDNELFQADTKGNGVPEILAIGDSFTWGRGVKYEDIFTTLLFKMLKENGYRPNIKNCGKGGANIEEIVRIHSYETFRKKYPVVLYGFVVNDFGLHQPVTGSDFIDKNNGVASFKAYGFLDSARNVSKTLHFILFCFEKYRLNTTTTKAYLDAFKGENAQKKFALISQMNQKTKSEGGKFVIMLFPFLYDLDNYPFKEIHEAVASFCAKEEIPLLDLLPYYSVYTAEELWVNPTDHHPNEIAHKITADRLYHFLIEHKLLSQKDDTPWYYRTERAW